MIELFKKHKTEVAILAFSIFLSILSALMIDDIRIFWGVWFLMWGNTLIDKAASRL